MKRILVTALAGAIALSACASHPKKTAKLPMPRPSGAVMVRVGIPENHHYRIIEVPLEDYVIGAALAEVSLAGARRETAIRMLEVQMLLARTYAVVNLGRHEHDGFDLCATTHCQLFKPSSAWSAMLVNLAQQAEATTKGDLILHAGAPIQALYHSNCGGYTSAADAVWEGPSRPYLQAVSDTFCQIDHASEWHWSVQANRLRDALNEDPRTKLDGRLNRIDVVSRDVAGRAVRVSLGGKGRIVSGTVLRSLVMQRFGPRSMRSTRFDVRRTGDVFIFEGRGNGHGAGLCQAGAIARAEVGQSTTQILQHYFPGIRISNQVTAAVRAPLLDFHKPGDPDGANPGH